MMQDTKELTSFSEVNNGFDPINQIKGLPYISLDSKNIFGPENTNKDKIIFSIIKESKKITTEKFLFDTDNSQESIPKKDEEKAKIPKFISFNEIKKKFGNTLNEISKDFFNVDQSSLLKAENELQSYTIKKINISDEFNNSQDKEEQKDINAKKKFGLGRKKKGDETERKHDIFASDNIIKKIKGFLFKNLVLFFNKIIKKDLILELNYKKYINHLKKDENFKYLHMSIKDLLSLEISPFYRGINPKLNKINIKKILDEEKKNDIVMFILNMKFREWMNIFTMNEDIKSFDKLNIFKKNMPTIIGFLKQVLEKNKNLNYLRYILLYLFNYERWFIIKNSRRSKRKKI